MTRWRRGRGSQDAIAPSSRLVGDLVGIDSEPAVGGPTGRKRPGIVRQSAATSVAAALGVLSGLLLDVAIAAGFGATARSDAFFVGATIPLGVMAALMVSANQALVPTITGWSASCSEREVWRLVSALLTLTVLGGAALAALFAALAPLVVPLIAPGLDASTLDLAVEVAQYMGWIVPLVALAEILRAMLNARLSFVAPAMMRVAFNGTAAAILVVSPWASVRGLVLAFLGGAIVQVMFLGWACVADGFRYVPTLAWSDARMRAAGALCVRPTLAALLNPVTRIAVLIFASFLPVGSISILNYGYRLISAIGGAVFFRSIIVTVVPRLTRAVGRGDDGAAADLTGLALRLMMLASLPLTAFVAVLGAPAARVAFERGEFDRTDAAALGLVLAVYALSLPGSAIQRALLAPFFARLDTRVPLYNTIIGVAANLVLLPIFVLPFSGSTAAIAGVAAAYSLAQYVNVVHANRKLRVTMPAVLIENRPFAVRIGISSVVAACVMVAVRLALGLDDIETTIGVFAGLVVTGAAGMVALSGCLVMLVTTRGIPVRTSLVRFVTQR